MGSIELKTGDQGFLVSAVGLSLKLSWQELEKEGVMLWVVCVCVCEN